MQRSRRGAVSVAALFFLNGTLFGGWASRIPHVKEGFDLPADKLSLLLLLLAGGAILSFSLAGRWIDAYGSQWVSKMLVYAYCVATIMVGFASHLSFLAISLALFGFTFGAMDVAMNAWASDVEKSRSKPIMSFFHAVFSIGAAFGAAIGALCLYLDLSIEFQFAVTAICLSVITLSLLGRVERSTKARPDKIVSKFKLPAGIIILLGLIAGASALGEGALVDWSALYLIEVHDMSAEFAVIGFIIFSVSMVAMRLSGDFFIARFGRFYVLLLASVSAFVGAIIVILGFDPLWVYAGYFLMGCGYAPVMPIAFSVAGKLPNISAGSAIAGVAIFAYGGTLLGPPLIGFTAHHSSFPIAFGILFICATVSILLSLLARKPLSS